MSADTEARTDRRPNCQVSAAPAPFRVTKGEWLTLVTRFSVDGVTMQFQIERDSGAKPAASSGLDTSSAAFVPGSVPPGLGQPAGQGQEAKAKAPQARNCGDDGKKPELRDVD